MMPSAELTFRRSTVIARALGAMRVGFVVLLIAAPVFAAAQTDLVEPDRTPAPQLLTRCAGVSLVSTSGWLSPRILADTLSERPEFQSAGLRLVKSDESPDVNVSVTDEYDERQSFQHIAGGGYHDAYIRAVRVRDGKVANTKVAALGSYEGIVAAAVVDALHQLCPAVMTAATARSVALETPRPAVIAQLQQAHSLAVDSFTYLDDDAFVRKLAARAEVRAWRLEVSTRRGDADLRLEIRRLPNTSTWECRLFDRSRQLLWMHAGSALTEEHAVVRIIDSLLAQIARYRDTPVAPSRNALAASPVRKGVWHVRLITGDFRTTLQPMDITIDGEHFIARNVLGQQVASIGAAQIEDVEHSTVRDPVFQLPPPTAAMAFIGEEAEGGGTAHDPRLVAGVVLGIIGYCTTAGALTAVLFPFNPKQHFVEIAWRQDDVEHKAMFQLTGRDARKMLAATRSLMESERGRK